MKSLFLILTTLLFMFACNETEKVYSPDTTSSVLGDYTYGKTIGGVDMETLNNMTAALNTSLKAQAETFAKLQDAVAGNAALSGQVAQVIKDGKEAIDKANAAAIMSVSTLQDQISSKDLELATTNTTLTNVSADLTKAISNISKMKVQAADVAFKDLDETYTTATATAGTGNTFNTGN